MLSVLNVTAVGNLCSVAGLDETQSLPHMKREPLWMTALELACPDCAGRLRYANNELSCVQCLRRFPVDEGRVSLLPARRESRSELALGSKYLGRAASLRGWRKTIYRRLYVDSVRFIGDRQKVAGKNAHAKLLSFVDAESAIPVLDIGSGDRRLRPNVVTADLARAPNVDLQLDAHSLPLTNECVSRIVLQHVLEHVESPRKVISEAIRVLRPGGRLYVEVPFLFPVHDRADYRRWSTAGLTADILPLHVIESGVTVGPWSALAVTARAALTHRIQNSYLSTAVDLIAGWILAPVGRLDGFLPAKPETQIGAGAIYVVAEKVTVHESP